MLRDNYGRLINYLRLAVTDRCNLRCSYCMPAEGNEWVNRNELLTFEEIFRITDLLISMGIEKIRITGGEPFVRRDLMSLLWKISRIKGLNEITITTNGVLTEPFIPEMIKLGIRSVNLSLDTLNRETFIAITHRDYLNNVLKTLDSLLKNDLQVKINAVIMDGKNTDDILNLISLTKNENISLRFIEEMPFNGRQNIQQKIRWNYIAILNYIRESFPDIYKIPDPPNSTSCNYKIPGYNGQVGIIAAYTRSFCGTCNRIRITPDGKLKTCLYDNGVKDIRKLLRENNDDYFIKENLMEAIGTRKANGIIVEKMNAVTNHSSMATIGG